MPVHGAQVSGEVLQQDGKAVKGIKLSGKWDEELRVTMPDGSERLLWRVSPPAADPSRYMPLHTLGTAHQDATASEQAECLAAQLPALTQTALHVTQPCQSCITQTASQMIYFPSMQHCSSTDDNHAHNSGLCATVSAWIDTGQTGET